MMKFTTAACALALGIAWVAAPAIAQETTKAKAEEKADKVRSTAEGKSDTVGGKMENAWDKTKAKTKEMKDKVVGKFGADRASANGDVRSAQMALKEKGFDPGPIDGVMGPRTKAAVKEFQQKENLTATGQLDADTRSHLIVSAPAASPAAEPKEKKQSQ
jgi:peptidoglycan hydrolase-like protein with peptidoglycan-binding domain